MPFPYEKYEMLAKPLSAYFPKGQDYLVHLIIQSIDEASRYLEQLLGRPIPKMQLILVEPSDWHLTPRDDPEEPDNALPYWTNATQPLSLFIPIQLDPIIGVPTWEKLIYLLYSVLTHVFLDDDPRPWPEESPLWADEWQMQFAGLSIMHHIQGQLGIVMKDLHVQYAEIFEPELDGKTPVTVRGFDWYEDTSEEDYLIFNLLIERFAADLLKNYYPEILPRFLDLYRNNCSILLSDDVTNMLANILGTGGTEWLEGLIYF
jgi:hypothetical protein